MGRAAARGYDSPLRSEQRAQTRDRIVDAATELLADEAVDELTIPLVADRAGVSVRTVYFHFPTKDDLSETVAERLDTVIGAISYPDSSAELPAFAEQMFREFERNQKVVRAVLKTKAGREVRARGRTRRLRDLERVLGPELAGLSPLQRRQRLAAIYIFLSGPAWQAMSDYFGLDADETARAAAWGMGALLRELERDATGNEDGVA